MPGIVSLLPSATEWVYALGLADRLAAVTFECDEPGTARLDHEVVVTGLATQGLTPGEIDALVRTTAAAGGPMYLLD
ncbi:MAG: cobalamin-binding protein, partial [Actinomycetota bacterium]